jgi:tetratricopeptide (TPR) repeat protein
LADGPNVALAIIHAQRFLADYQDHWPAWTRLGALLADVARYEEAKLAYASALEFCPANKRWVVLVGLGHSARRAGNFDEAAAWYRKASAAAPREAGNYIFLGAVLARQGRLSAAEAVHRAATRCAEGCIDEAFLNLGLVLRAQERFEEAADCLREAIRLDPEYYEARLALRDVERCIAARLRGR